MIWLVGVLSLLVQAAPPAFDLVPLKSGTYVHLESAEHGRPGRIAFVQIQEDGETAVWLCAVPDGARWHAWETFFSAIAAEAMPARLTAPDDGNCVGQARFGSDDKTRNSVMLFVRRGQGDASGFKSTIGRREAGMLAERTRALGDYVPPKVAGASAPGPGADGAQPALRLLYLARGWTQRTDDPGWVADLASAQAVLERQGDLPGLLLRALNDRRVRPGALADLSSEF
jgi:hypothetical protein